MAYKRMAPSILMQILVENFKDIYCDTIFDQIYIGSGLFKFCSPKTFEHTSLAYKLSLAFNTSCCV